MALSFRPARIFSFQNRSKNFLRFVRMSILLLCLTFTALLCITLDVSGTIYTRNTYNLKNIEEKDDEIFETSTTTLSSIGLYPIRHKHLSHRKQHAKESETKKHFLPVQNTNKYNTIKTLNSEQQSRSLEKLRNKRLQVKVEEKHLSTSLDAAKSNQTLPIKSEQTEKERAGLSVARGYDLNTSSNSSHMNRPLSVPIEQLKGKSDRKHTRNLSKMYLRGFSKTKNEEEVLSKSPDTLGGLENPREILIEDDVLWGKRAEELIPEGLVSDEWSDQTRSCTVVEVTEGCGRMQNRLVIADDGTKMCARYRMNKDQTQGEVFSYYLSRVLGIQNVPPLVLINVDSLSPQWSSVRQEIQDAGWKDGKLVILSQWVPDMAPVYIPIEFREDKKQLNPSNIVNRTYTEISELVQWSDMVIFDYLTANLDRLTNNMFNRQWNSFIMDSPVHNLGKSKNSGLLIFFDNESGLLHSYRLLDKFDKYHKNVLQSLCIFRGQTVKIIEELYHNNDISDKLFEEYKKHEPLHGSLSGLPKQNIDILTERIGDVYKQIQFCRQRNSHVKL